MTVTAKAAVILTEVEQAVNLERERCMMIAAYEAQYWREVGVVDIERPDMDGICIGAVGAAANICGAIATNQPAKPKTVESVARKETT